MNENKREYSADTPAAAHVRPLVVTIWTVTTRMGVGSPTCFRPSDRTVHRRHSALRMRGTLWSVCSAHHSCTAESRHLLDSSAGPLRSIQCCTEDKFSVLHEILGWRLVGALRQTDSPDRVRSNVPTTTEWQERAERAGTSGCLARDAGPAPAKKAKCRWDRVSGPMRGHWPRRGTDPSFPARSARSVHSVARRLRGRRL
jgi:hypothetical protein